MSRAALHSLCRSARLSPIGAGRRLQRACHFFTGRSSGWTQCKVAGAELNLTTCCQSPVPGACNVAWYLDKALTRTHNFVSIVSSTIGFDQVKAEIDAGRPVGARIGWSGGGGHFVAIYGYTRILGVADYFDIDDPIYGKSHLTVSDFSSNYQGSGSWTHTYYTKSYIRFMIVNPLLLADEVLRHIWEVRPLLGVKAGLPFAEIERTEGRTLGLAHPVFTLGLDALTGEQAARRRRQGVRVIELNGKTPERVLRCDGCRDGQGAKTNDGDQPLFAVATACAGRVTARYPQNEKRFD